MTSRCTSGRRSYDVAPAPLPEDDPRNPALRSPLRRDSRRRAAPHRVVERHRGPHDALLGVRDTPGAGPPRRTAGGGSLATAAGIIKNLKGISDEAISEFNLPTAVPYVFEFDEGLGCVKDYFGATRPRSPPMEAVAQQGRRG